VTVEVDRVGACPSIAPTKQGEEEGRNEERGETTAVRGSAARHPLLTHGAHSDVASTSPHPRPCPRRQPQHRPQQASAGSPSTAIAASTCVTLWLAAKS
jgi:hypothetical protein